MARLAERLQCTGEKRGAVAMVRLDVIADRRRLDDAALQAEFAQWMFKKLVSPNMAPALSGVETTPNDTMAHG